MNDMSMTARRPRRLVPDETSALDWMTVNGRPGYWQRVNTLHEHFDEVVAEAGPGGNYCEITQARLDAIDAEIAEEAMDAIERIRDWASDSFD